MIYYEYSKTSYRKRLYVFNLRALNFLISRVVYFIKFGLKLSEKLESFALLLLLASYAIMSHVALLLRYSDITCHFCSEVDD